VVKLEVVSDHSLQVDGYALYLRYEDEQGDTLAQWLCDYPDHHWLTPRGKLLATSYSIP
jgi:hypothetical protein